MVACGRVVTIKVVMCFHVLSNEEASCDLDLNFNMENINVQRSPDWEAHLRRVWLLIFC